ncbi:septum formation initiator family protein, partial [Streptomyces sp. NPDC029704]|uniref:septum formation initiator family protein n=1 Tax=Streptomyces sp. NPDC029704 TaxID=3156920 RepID=UPI0033FF98F6
MSPAARRGTRLARVLPAGPAGARRTPFVLLVVVLLGSGLISLLLLNSSLNQGSFELSRLQRKTTELTDEQQALQQEVDQLAAPDALERRAREMGMVPGGSPAFLGPDGTVRGVPAPAGTEDPAAPASYTAPAPPREPATAPDPLLVPPAAHVRLDDGTVVWARVSEAQ